MILTEQEGIYCIVFQLEKNTLFQIGKLGEQELKPGFYFYCGSAKGKGGISRRVNRHLKKDTKKFWHIDYLKEKVNPIRIWFLKSQLRSECDLVQVQIIDPKVSYSMRGFGASDCMEHCYSHLLYAPDTKNLDDVFMQLQKKMPHCSQCLIDR